MADVTDARIGGMTLVKDDSWVWTDQTYEILGFRPGDVPATTALLLSHVHPDSRDQAARLLDPTVRGLVGGTLTLLDAAGRERSVVLSGTSSEQGLSLQLLDVTEEYARRSAVARAAAVTAATSARSAIDQTVGALRLVYGMSEPEAFSLLSWASQRSGEKLRLLAERTSERLAAAGPLPMEERRALDRVAFRAMENSPEETPPRLPVERLSTVHESVEGLTVLAVTGELDVRSAPGFTVDLVAALSGLDAREVLVVDLTRVDHVGEVGLSVLQGLVRRCARQQVSLRVVLSGAPTDGVEGLRQAGASLHLGLSSALAA